MMSIPSNLIHDIATPAYLYDLGILRATLLALNDAASIDGRFKVHYAVKANFRPELLEIIQSYGLGADCVSGNEIKAAVSAGFNPEEIFFAGVGKTDREIETALSLNIGCLNVESEPELRVISEIASQHGCIAPIALRVNPEIDAHTHQYITTGLSNNKFGIPMSQLDHAVDLALSLPACHLKGLHFHIGSQICRFDSYRLLCDRVNSLTAHFASRGIRFESLNMGGGLGINYENPDTELIPQFDSFFRIFKESLSLEDGQTLHFELGRAIVAQCGSLISRVLYVKEVPGRNFAIIDAGMTDLIRPALYQAHHAIDAINPAPETLEKLVNYDVVGPVCESSDVFATDILLPELKRGNLLAIRSAGAYGEAMASRYNLRDLPHAVFI